MPWQLKLAAIRAGRTGDPCFNAFSSAASRVGVNAMPPDVRAAYVRRTTPGPTASPPALRAGHPAGAGDKAWALVEESGRRCTDTPTGRHCWPGACAISCSMRISCAASGEAAAGQSLIFDDAGHYVLEDKAAQIVPQVRRFLDAHPL